MKCSNCGIEIEQHFTHALKSNQCPGCGQSIMEAARLAAFISLKELLSSNFENVDSDEIANIIVANFEIKQLFKESVVKKDAAISSRVEEKNDDKESDEEHKKKQIKDAKEKLKELHKEAYESALKRQYGLETDEADIFNDSSAASDFDLENEDPITLANRMKTEHKRQESYKNMVSGSGKVARSS